MDDLAITVQTDTATPTPALTDPVAELMGVLDLKPDGDNRFWAQPREFGRRRLYGGQVFAQSVMAAQLSVEGRAPHSLHACFLLPGSPDHPVHFEVERMRDGGAFSSRRVQALQDGRVILTLLASFHRPEPGFDHQIEMPPAPDPETLASTGALLADWARLSGEIPHAMLQASMTQRMGLDVRPLEPDALFETQARPPHYAHWFRVCRSVADDPRLHYALLAFASDLGFLGTALRPHGMPWFAPDILPSTIDHSLWIHRPLRADDWLLYVMDSPTAQNARGFVRGTIYDRVGRLVASTAQDGLIRPVRRA